MTAPIRMIRRPSGYLPLGDIGTLREGARFVCGFEVMSDSGNKHYRCFYDRAQECWVCDCTGNINHGKCKHLTRAGLAPNRADIKRLAEAKAIGAAEDQKDARRRVKETPTYPGGTVAGVPRFNRANRAYVAQGARQSARTAQRPPDTPQRPIVGPGASGAVSRPLATYEPAPQGAKRVTLPESFNRPPVRRVAIDEE